MKTARIYKQCVIAVLLTMGVIPAVVASTIHYVSPSGTHIAPFADWSTAATNIQAAIDVADVGDVVLVTNGVYDTGGRATGGQTTTNRIVIDKPLLVQSVNGPVTTTIQGQGPKGTNAVRCAYVADGAALIGFTLTNGFTQTSFDNSSFGGGVYCDSARAVVSNCFLTGNSASAGGGAYSGALYNCTFAGNSASFGAGAYNSALDHCVLTANSAGYSGGGVSGCALRYCSLIGNVSVAYAGGAVDSALDHCELTGNIASDGGGAYNCALSDCALIGNSAAASCGGALGGALDRCLLKGNSASNQAGGVALATLNNCALIGNSAGYAGGGVTAGTLNNCTVIGNSAGNSNGGVSGGSRLINCIVYYNQAPNEANYDIGSTFEYCCIFPMGSFGAGVFTNAPGLAGMTNPRLIESSPCIDAGNNDNVFGAVDLDGDARTNGAAVDVGCDEFWADSCTGTIQVAILTPGGALAVVGYPLLFQADIAGRPVSYVWRFGDGISSSNELLASHIYDTPGEYSVTLEAANLSGGMSTTLTVRIISLAEATWYVAVNGDDAADGRSWATAKATIQGGIDVAVPGGLVLASNGVYATGGAFVAGLMNRAAVTKALTVQSMNGPAVTLIQGRDPMGMEFVRCAYVADGAALIGFTLTNGFTQTLFDKSGSGGGVYCDSTAGVISNCVLTGNSANYGGGAFGGALYHCTLTGNSASYGGGMAAAELYHCELTDNSAVTYGGGAFNGALFDCALEKNSADSGGGAFNAMFNNCVLTRNTANFGGGTYLSMLNNCVLTGNTATYTGGGILYGQINNGALIGNSSDVGGGAGYLTLNNCTLVGNSARYGGGASGCALNNCIIYYNLAGQEANYDSGSILNYCCAMPLPLSGAGNFTNDPGLAGLSNPLLTEGSPCIDAGNNDYVFTAVDLDGEARTNGITVDVGCDEFWADSCTGTLQVAILTPGGATAVVGHPLLFQANVVGRPLTYVWRFDDGTSISNELMMSRIYDTPGEYSVTLEAANLSGVASITMTVRILSLAEATWYVAVGGDDTADGRSWATAKATIQAGIDAAVSGGLVLVSNGVYATGGTFAAGLTNRVALTNVLTVRSMNGPEATIIQGQGPVGFAAIRCAYVADGARLVGFTLTNGFTQDSLDNAGSGGGVYCDSTTGIVSNCILTGNSAAANGGGAYHGALEDCVLIENSASDGGGAYNSLLHHCELTENSANYGGGISRGTLYHCALTRNTAMSYGGGTYVSELHNCALTGNSAGYDGGGSYGGGSLDNCTLIGNSATFTGGGAVGCALNNCIIYYNNALYQTNYDGSCTLNYCCAQPLPFYGSGNFTNAPRLAGLSNPRLTEGSPCIDAGNNDYVFTAADLDGDARTNGTAVDVGCDEFWADSCTGTLQVAILTPGGVTAVVGYPLSFQANIDGRPLNYVWRFGDGASTTNEFMASHTYDISGEYSVTLEAANLSGVASATVTVRILSLAEATRYVAANGDDTADGLSWETAKATIQAGIDVTLPGGLVLVSNGVYAAGGAFAAGLQTRVVITNAVTVQSANGPEATIIEGQGPMGIDAVRCVYLADGTALIGFTLTNGCTQTFFGDSGAGGGVFCDSAFGIVSNCALTGNSANIGGGAYKGTFYHCALTGNSAVEHGGAVYNSTLHRCVLTGNSANYNGGGAYDSELYSCALTGNYAGSGGGVFFGTLHNCALMGNSAFDGGGAKYGTLYNCTLVGNSAVNMGGGSAGGSLFNCIIYYNTAPDGANCDTGSTLDHCCTTPMPSTSGKPGSNPGNFTNVPSLAGLTNPRLIQGSPCIDAGDSVYVFTDADLDGEPRTNGAAVDVGCDEFWADSCTGTLQVAILTPGGDTSATGYPLSFQANIEGHPVSCVWRFGDGTSTTNETDLSHVFESAGDYTVTLEVSNLTGSASATVAVRIIALAEATRYVAVSGDDMADGLSWATAKATIQAGVDAVTIPGGLVLVSNGVYAAGGVFAAGLLSRVAITNPVTVQNMNGPDSTIIQGQGSLGPDAMRCAYVADGARLVGFTLTNGFTDVLPGDFGSGGGVYCDSAAGIVSDCVLSGNAAFSGGGVYRGTLYNCLLIGNLATAFGGGESDSALFNCTLTGNTASDGGALYDCALSGNQASRSGGGAYGGALYHCELLDNSANSQGGGAYNGALHNCRLAGNSGGYGGGAAGGNLDNCALIGNQASTAGGGANDAELHNCALINNSAFIIGGGAYGGALDNSILYYNQALNEPNYGGSVALNYCCATPLPISGVGNFTNAPGLAGVNNPHLVQSSPCIDAGNSNYVFSATDLDGDARIQGTTGDVGCDEFWVDSCTGTLQVVILTPAGTNAVVGSPLSFEAEIGGRPVSYVWRFDDGTSISNEVMVSHAFENVGEYPVTLEAVNLNGGTSATVMVRIVSLAEATRYVAINGDDMADGLSWATAKATIQAGVDAVTIPGGLVLVSNGVYAAGGAFAANLMNRVALTHAVTVQSMNGPEATIIQGEGPMGLMAVRCAYVADGTALIGFTLTNGFAQTYPHQTGYGGGVYCDSTAGIVSNCTLTGNVANYGGGAYGGTLYQQL